MMRTLRENTKWIMLITAIAFVGLMVFEWGMDASGGSAEAFTGGEAGRVNGAPITYAEYNQVHRTLTQQRQEQVGRTMSSAEFRQIEEEAWDQLVMDRLIDQELRRRGISVTDEEIRQAALYMPPPEFHQHEAFQVDGQFDLTSYHEFLRSPAADPQLLVDLEMYYRQMIPRSKLFQQINASVVVTDSELWHMYRQEQETASARFIRLDPPQLVPEHEVTVTDRQIRDYYDEHRDQFVRPARAEVRIVALDKRPTAADTMASLERASEIRQEIVAERVEFEDMARQESVDRVSAERGGHLGPVQRGQTAQPFEEAVWRAPIGELTEPVLTEFGFHLIRVNSRTQDQADVSHILVAIERTIESEDALLSRVDALEALVERMSLPAAAEEMELRYRTTELTPILGSLPNVGPVDEALDWVFQERPAPGEASQVLENERAYYVVELLTREDERPLTLEEATTSIRTILVRQQQREQTRALGQQLVDQIRAGATLEGVAAGIGVDVNSAEEFTRLDFVPGIGQANAAIGAAFGLPVGQVSDLVATADAFFILRTTDRTEADRDEWEQQLPFQRQQVVAMLQRQRIDQYLEGLHQEARIVDHRDRLLDPGI